MWFKNLHIYRLVEPFTLTAEQLHGKLIQDSARQCGSLERSTYGWRSPLGPEHDFLVQQCNGCLFIAARKEEKLLPASVVKERVEERIAIIELEQDRKVGSKEKRALSEEITIQLLPQAFSKGAVIYAYIDPAQGLLLIDTSSTAKAEEFTVLLRKSLGSLKLLAPEVEHSITALMTKWLAYDELPRGFNVEDTCEMQDPEHAKSVLKCMNMDLMSEEIQNHIKAGKQIIKLDLTWEDRVTFMLDGDLTLKRIGFLDLVQDQRDELDAAAPEEKLLADFSILAGEFSALLPELFQALGGLTELAGSESRASASEEVLEFA